MTNEQAYDGHWWGENECGSLKNKDFPLFIDLGWVIEVISLVLSGLCVCFLITTKNVANYVKLSSCYYHIYSLLLIFLWNGLHSSVVLVCLWLRGSDSLVFTIDVFFFKLFSGDILLVHPESPSVLQQYTKQSPIVLFNEYFLSWYFIYVRSQLPFHFKETCIRKRTKRNVTPVGQVEFLSCLHICCVTSCFILKINSPLVSGSLPFLMCHQSDCLPWFLIVSTCSPFPLMCTYSLCLPLACASVSCPFVLHTSLIAIVKSKYCLSRTTFRVFLLAFAI